MSDGSQLIEQNTRQQFFIALTKNTISEKGHREPYKINKQYKRFLGLRRNSTDNSKIHKPQGLNPPQIIRY